MYVNIPSACVSRNSLGGREVSQPLKHDYLLRSARSLLKPDLPLVVAVQKLAEGAHLSHILGAPRLVIDDLGENSVDHLITSVGTAMLRIVTGLAHWHRPSHRITHGTESLARRLAGYAGNLRNAATGPASPALPIQRVVPLDAGRLAGIELELWGDPLC